MLHLKTIKEKRNNFVIICIFLESKKIKADKSILCEMRSASFHR